MGIYDRDYERNREYDDSPGFHLGQSRSWTTNLLIFMGVVYIVQMLTRPGGQIPGNAGWFTDLFCLHADLPRHPWLAFELLTYGFLHSVDDLKHILFNGLALWMFGKSVEYRYGQKEYATFFFAAVAFAGVAWIASEFVMHRQLLPIPMLGASGGIAAVLLLFCLNFPHQKIFFSLVLPMPAWVFAIIFVGQDLLFAIRRNPDDNVAYTAHIGGALFALVYFQFGWRLSRWLPTGVKLPKLRRRPPLRVHEPTDDEKDADDAVVDDLLRKIKEHGQDSLTRHERRILEQASREYQKRRK